MEPNQYSQGLQRVLDYIENHLESRIILEDLSAEASYSPSHFVWIFRTVIGQTPMEYVRRRRMTEAAKAILAGDDIIDAAYRFGFSAQDTFTRSFRHTIGLPPGQFRQSGGILGIYTSALNLQHKGGFVMDNVFSDVRFESLDTMNVASCSVISRSPEVQVISYLLEWARERGIEGARAFGFDYPVSDDLKKQGFRGYEYWIVVPEHIIETEAVIIKNIPKNDYAVLRISDPTSDPFERIGAGWKKLQEWVLSRDLCPKTRGDRYWLEEVIESDNGDIFMDCYFPLK